MVASRSTSRGISWAWAFWIFISIVPRQFAVYLVQVIANERLLLLARAIQIGLPRFGASQTLKQITPPGGVLLGAADGFSKRLAAGLAFGFALQAFVIVGGILRVIPLTGITLPLVSYGGSAVVSNFRGGAGLMPGSDRANRGAAA